MCSAKDIVLKPIGAREANAFVKRVHYSGSYVRNSQLHIGAYLHGTIEGVMQFGPPLDKRKVLPLVEGTPWNGMLELNRMAFTDALPRNSESRAIAVAMRMLRKHAPHVEWVLSFADGAQCGDGTIYRASGFVLTQIKQNDQLWEFPGGEIATRMVATDTRRPKRGALLESCRKSTAFSRVTATKGGHIMETGGASMKPFIEAGARPIPGYQLRYIYFLDPTARERLTVPVLPFSAIDEAGARMYRGESLDDKQPAPEAEESKRPATSGEKGGSSPTLALNEVPA